MVSGLAFNSTHIFNCCSSHKDGAMMFGTGWIHCTAIFNVASYDDLTVLGT